MKTSIAPRTAAQSQPAAAPNPPRILIVDADESARSVLSVALSREGFEAQSAPGSVEAMRLVTQAPPELLVVASELREEDGFSFVAQLRGDRRTSSIPVLLLAKGGEAHLHELSRVVGVDEILLKPAFARDIAALVRLQLSPASRDSARRLLAEQLPVSHLLRAVLATSRAGVIELEQGRGRIAFRRGKVLDANFDGLHGVNGLIRGLVLARGEYKVTPRALAFDPVFHFTLKEMVSTVFPRLERWEHLVSRSLPLDATLGLDFSALGRALPSMPDAVNGVVRLFDGLRDVRQVLMDSPLDETVTLEVATRLYLMGVVIPVAVDSSGLARQDPHLFEPRPTEAVERMESLFTHNPTPIQAVLDVSAADEDWTDTTRGTGLELTDPSSEGWTTSQQLSPQLEQQLAAFNIQPVVEPHPAPVFAADLLEFSLGDAPDERPLETALAAPIPLVEVATTPAPVVVEVPEVELSVRALESEFFVDTDPTPLVALPRTRTLSEAVLGLSTEPRPLVVKATRLGAIGWMVVAGLMVGATAVTAWQFAQNQEVSAAEQVVAPAAPTPAPPPAVQVQALEPTLEGSIGAPDSAAALVEATRLYESGKIAEAARALEELVTQDSSSVQAWLMLGLARYDGGDVSGAQEAANTVLALDHKAARAHLLLATILIDSGHRPEANEEIQKYLELDPDGVFANEAKALLRR